MTISPRAGPESSDAAVVSDSAVELRGLIGRGFVYSASDAATAAVSLVVVPILARHLSTADFGVYGFLSGARLILAPLLGLGLVSSLRTLYHLGDERERALVIPTIVNAALAYSFTATTVISVGGAIFLTAHGDELPYTTHFVLTAWTVFGMSFYFLPLTIFALDHKPKRYAAFSLAVAGSNLVANIVLVVVFDQGLIGALWANLTSAMVGLGLAGAVVRRRYRRVIDRGQLRTALRIALPTLPYTLLSPAWRFSDRVFLTTLTTLSQAGVYTLAASIASAIPLGLGGISTAFNAEFYRRTGDGDPTFPGHWSRLFTVYVATAGTAWLAFANLAPQLVRAVGGDAYAAASDVLAVLAMGHALLAVVFHFAPGVERAQRTWAYVIATIPAFVLNIGLNAALVSRFGARGAAVAFAAASSVQLLIFARLSIRAFSFPLGTRELAVVVALAPALYTACSLGVTGVGDTFEVPIRIGTIAAYPILLVVFGVLPFDDARRIWRRARSR